jgi:glycosyltransferase involved in cell wall biosynthesis
MATGTIVQLFNGKKGRNHVIDPDSTPNHLKGEAVLTAAGFPVETLPAYDWPWNPLANKHNAYLGLDPLRALKVLLTRRDAALVCAHMESAVILLLLRRIVRFRPPIVIWEVPWSPGWAFRDRVSRLAVPRADMNVVFSSSQIERIHRLYGARVPTCFIPFCVDTDFFRPMPPPPGREPYVLSCGLDNGRDFDIILRAMTGCSVSVLIKAAKAPVFDAETNPAVTCVTSFLSFVEYREMYAAASVVVVTTKDTPNASGVTSLMEAMAMGKPVIVSDNPALRDYLPPKDAGIVIPVGDAAALRRAVDDLVQDPARAADMGRNARNYAEQHFTPEAHFRAVAGLFEQMIGASPHRRG